MTCVKNNLSQWGLLFALLLPIPSLGIDLSFDVNKNFIDSDMSRETEREKRQFLNIGHISLTTGIVLVSCCNPGCSACVSAGIHAILSSPQYYLQASQVKEVQRDLDMPTSSMSPPPLIKAPNLSQPIQIPREGIAGDEELQEFLDKNINTPQCGEPGCFLTVEEDRSITAKTEDGGAINSKDFDPKILEDPEVKQALKKAGSNPAIRKLSSKLKEGQSKGGWGTSFPEGEEEEDSLEEESRDVASSPRSLFKTLPSEDSHSSDNNDSILGSDRSSTLRAQFAKLSKQKKGLREKKTLPPKEFQGDKIGRAGDNIFLMVHKRYQKVRENDEFLEGITL